MTETVASASASAEEVPVHTHADVPAEPVTAKPATPPVEGTEPLGSRERASRSAIAAHDRISALRTVVATNEAVLPATAPPTASKPDATTPPKTLEAATAQVNQLLHLIRELHAAIKNPIPGVD